MTVRCDHHGNFYLLITQPRNTAGPFPFDHRPALKPQTKLYKKLNHFIERLYSDADVIHPL
jgi:hypothetical protein